MRKLDAYWRAANYLSVGQIYLYDNPLLKKPLTLAHIKPRLLGHWGTTPGLNFIYVHLNRVINAHDLNVIYITGPGHGGPGIVANTYLEGTYSEVYPNISQDEDGMKRLFTQFSFPGGIPSHVAPETPGSIHEGGELGYSLSHAFGAAFDNPDLLVACVVGDGEAETGPLATSWHSNKFLNPVHDGAVLPILHLNGYKIAGPTVLARIPRDELEALFRGYGYTPYVVEGDDPMDDASADGRDARHGRRRHPAASSATPAPTGSPTRPRWPMIILRSPKGWTGPKVVDGKRTEGTFRSHQVPMGDMSHPGHVKILEKWMRSYRPQELFDTDRPARSRARGTRPQGRAPHERQSPRQRRPPAARSAAAGFPRLRRDRATARAPSTAEATRVQGEFIRDVINRNAEQLPRVQPGRNELESVERRVRGDEPVLDRGDSSRRRPRRARWARDGNAQRASMRRLARRLSAHRAPRVLLLLRGVHPHRRFDVQPARQVAQGGEPHSMAAADCLAELPAVVACVASGPQRFQPSGPRLHRPCREQESRGRPGLSATGCEHAALRDRPLPPQPELRQRRSSPGSNRRRSGSTWTPP